MLEKALVGSSRYKVWMAFLLALMGIGGLSYIQQYNYGLGYTGMSRDVSWGVYIAQFTFLVGVAASGVMVVLPYYLHNYKVFGKITILGEFLAVASVSMCLMFIMVDLGQPLRALNVLLHPTPHSILFWDMIVLNVYLFLNIFVGWVVLTANKKEMPPPKWIKPFIYISIPWAVSIHTVTAFLYAGLPGRHFWLTAILAPRFLASAFAAGPALLILLCLVIKRVSKFDAGQEAIQKLVTIIAYAALINVFFVLLEFFTSYYSNIPGHMDTLNYLFFGLRGHHQLVPWMWTSVVLGISAIVMLLVPYFKLKEGFLALACVMIFFSLWIDKGIGLVIGGFVPNPLEEITPYYLTFGEVLITLGIWATGFFILTVLYKIALAVREEELIV
ncbi:MAG: polysulfide reductase NrfD [Desulfobacterales bacterium]|nr:polysulfide reductase NrfD [Desulfobacterales bacterium]